MNWINSGEEREQFREAEYCYKIQTFGTHEIKTDLSANAIENCKGGGPMPSDIG